VAPGQQVSDTHPPHPPTHPPTRLRPTNDPPTNHHHPPTTNITHTTDTTTATTTNTTITTITIATTTHHLSVFRYRSMLTTPGEDGKNGATRLCVGNHGAIGYLVACAAIVAHAWHNACGYSPEILDRNYPCRVP
jgi:hypothetical protein